MTSLFLEVLYGVDWREPWLVGLLIFHALTTLAIFLLRHHTYLQAAILGLLALLCYFSENINEYAAENYELFSEEQYFDANGFFILVVFSGPILLNCFLIVLWWLWSVWEMMGKVGAMKLRKKQQQQQHKGTTAAREGQQKQKTPSQQHHQASARPGSKHTKKD